jgi:hypothetical protein
MGGPVYGAGGATSDSIPARLSNGEFVVNAHAANQPGVMDFLTHLNAKGYAAGGPVYGPGMPSQHPIGVAPGSAPNPNAFPAAPQGGQAGAPGPGGYATPGGYGSLLAPFTTDQFHQYSPAYQFQLQQGQQAVLNGDASSVGAESGAASKDLINYNQGLADTAFNNAFNQYQTQQGNIYSRLAGLTQLGQNAASNTGAQGTQLAGNIGQSVASAGAAQAAGQVGSANAWSGALGSASYIPWLMSKPPSGGGGGDGQM